MYTFGFSPFAPSRDIAEYKEIISPLKNSILKTNVCVYPSSNVKTSKEIPSVFLIPQISLSFSTIFALPKSLFILTFDEYAVVVISILFIKSSLLTIQH